MTKDDPEDLERRFGQAMKLARAAGHQQGKREGREEGLTAGRLEGYKEGHAAGRKEYEDELAARLDRELPEPKVGPGRVRLVK